MSADEYRLECGSAEHNKVKSVAVLYLFMWPIGMPFLFVVLLIRARKAIKARRPSALSNATKFLHKEYDAAFFWWELLHG